MTHGSLFSGIGGFDLAAEWMGWENKFHCEWNEFGQRVLNYYWPDAELFTDITKSDFKKYANTIDVLTGGFPCQPYSAAGKRLGKEDERHLWPKCLEQYERLPRVTSWAKTFAALLIGMEGWYSTRCVLTWKILGIKSRPLLYLRALSMRHTNESAFGLLPTVTAMDSTNATANMKSTQVKPGSMHSMTLVRYMMQNPILNTPCASDKNGGCTRSNPKMQYNSSLINEMHGALNQPAGKTSQLNPRFVAEMMGFPPNWTELPFQNGAMNQ